MPDALGIPLIQEDPEAAVRLYGRAAALENQAIQVCIDSGHGRPENMIPEGWEVYERRENYFRLARYAAIQAKIRFG